MPGFGWGKREARAGGQAQAQRLVRPDAVVPMTEDIQVKLQFAALTHALLP